MGGEEPPGCVRFARASAIACDLRERASVRSRSRALWALRRSMRSEGEAPMRRFPRADNPGVVLALWLSSRRVAPARMRGSRSVRSQAHRQGVTLGDDTTGSPLARPRGESGFAGLPTQRREDRTRLVLSRHLVGDALPPHADSADGGLERSCCRCRSHRRHGRGDCLTREARRRQNL